MFLNWLFILVAVVEGEIICYHCVSRLDDSIGNKTEKDMLKTLLFSRFNVPPSSDYCSIGGIDLLFQTVDKKRCVNDTDMCISIVSSVDQNAKTTRLVIRGCQQELMKPGYHLKPTNLPTELISTCNYTLCNSSHFSSVNYMLGLIVGLYLLIRE